MSCLLAADSALAATLGVKPHSKLTKLIPIVHGRTLLDGEKRWVEREEKLWVPTEVT